VGSNKFIGVWTSGLMALGSEVREQVEQEFADQAKRVDDYFYPIEVNGKMCFVVENGEFGYTTPT
jgi:septal ring-binding cell division protein DamX